MAIAPSGSLETIFPASSHTLQVLLCNKHLFIIPHHKLIPSINKYMLISAESLSDHFAISLIHTSKKTVCHQYGLNLNANKKNGCKQPVFSPCLFADSLIDSSVALPAETIDTLYAALCHNPSLPPPL